MNTAASETPSTLCVTFENLTDYGCNRPIQLYFAWIYWCPSSHDFVYDNKKRQIGIYELLEDVPADEDSFDGKAGDILVGGGIGEAAALRISYPDAFDFFRAQTFYP